MPWSGLPPPRRPLSPPWLYSPGGQRRAPNNAPVFFEDLTTHTVPENSPAGTSARSNVASATTVAAGPAATNPVLPPPQDVNAVPKLPGEIRLGWWRNPNAASHDLVDRHQYRYRVRNASAWIADWTSVNQTMLPGTTEIRNYNSVLLKGLTAGTAYEFQVRSTDKGGGNSAVVSALGTAVGGQTVWIEADTRSVREGAPLRFTLSRDQPHGSLRSRNRQNTKLPQAPR